MASWPECVLDEVEPAIGATLPDYAVVRRALRPQDPPRSISLVANDWAPVRGSFEIPSDEPTINTYRYVAEVLVKHADEVAGRREYARTAKIVRAVLWRDQNLLVRLRGLDEVLLGTRESFMRLRVTSQSFLGTNVNASWYFVATTNFEVETSVTPV